MSFFSDRGRLAASSCLAPSRAISFSTSATVSSPFSSCGSGSATPAASIATASSVNISESNPSSVSRVSLVIGAPFFCDTFASMSMTHELDAALPLACSALASAPDFTAFSMRSISLITSRRLGLRDAVFGSSRSVRCTTFGRLYSGRLFATFLMCSRTWSRTSSRDTPSWS